MPGDQVQPAPRTLLTQAEPAAIADAVRRAEGVREHAERLLGADADPAGPRRLPGRHRRPGPRAALPLHQGPRPTFAPPRLQIRKGDRVGIFYASANHDPEVFENPDAFDITRDPNPHLGFGGGGPHYCLGKSLAVLEIDLIFNAVADAMPGLKQAGDPRRLRSSWINGVKELQVSAS